MSGTTVHEDETSRQSSAAAMESCLPQPDRGNRKSCLYVGSVRHRRFSPVEHLFERKLYMVSIDLEEVDQVFRFPGLWSTQRWSLCQFRRADYLGPAERPLVDCVRDLVERQLGLRLNGPIRLLTQIRTFGLVFNPVSLYYCYDAAGERLEAVVAEVTNTPWGERHAYVLPYDADQRIVRFQNAKEFHVSPFLPMEMRYHWRMSTPADRLSIQIENHDDAQCVFDATLQLRRRPLTIGSILTLGLRFPLMSAQIMGAIYWQALRLWWKKAPYFPHPPKQHTIQQTDSATTLSAQPVEELQ